MTAILALHAATTLAMTGLIWFVQVVHYPLFRYAANADFPLFAAAHQKRTGLVVVPLMLVELTTAVLLALAPALGRDDQGPPALIGLGLLAAIWLSTALLQVPLHRRLLSGFDARAARTLVRSNWLRTVAWSARGVLALGLLAS